MEVDLFEADEEYQKTPTDICRPVPQLGEALRGYKSNDKSRLKTFGGTNGSPAIASGGGGAGGSDRMGVGWKLMSKVGYRDGAGLGKNEQGDRQSIAVVEKLDNAGLGFEATIKAQSHTADERYAPETQKPEFISTKVGPMQAYSLDVYTAFCVVGKRQAVDYNVFASRAVVDQIMNAKTRFDSLDRTRFLMARRDSNPYETIGKSIFCNRAAVKMANLDKLYSFTRSTNYSVDSKTKSKTFRWADICAGPGGFTEYLYYRCTKDQDQPGKGPPRGWGFTLRGECDFQVHKFNPQSPHANWEACYGADGTGNIFNEENIRHFMQKIDADTDGQGVDLVMGDGGASVDGVQNQQEYEMRQLVLCQFLTALCILKKHGNFVCKIFDMFTPFTVGLLYILFRHFQFFSIVKPHSSRPANSERYVVGINLTCRRPPIVNYLFHVNSQLHSLAEGDDVISVIPMEKMASEPKFLEYIKEYNINIGKRQVTYLENIIKHVEDRNMVPVEQEDVKRRCLKEWNLPPPEEEGTFRPKPQDLRQAAAVIVAQIETQRKGPTEEEIEAMKLRRMKRKLPVESSSDIDPAQIKKAIANSAKAKGKQAQATPATVASLSNQPDKAKKVKTGT